MRRRVEFCGGATPSPGERGDREAVGEERRQNQHRNRPDRCVKTLDYCPHSSSGICSCLANATFPPGEGFRPCGIFAGRRLDIFCAECVDRTLKMCYNLVTL